MKASFGNTQLCLKVGDITEENSIAIVNAANQGLMGGGGVDGAIHKKGGEQILRECKSIVQTHGKCLAGNAVVTSAGLLKAEFVIHTVGPFWKGGRSGESKILNNCYLNSLKQGKAYGIKTISFPSIATGAYGYPVKLAARVALSSVIEGLESDSGFTKITFVLFDDSTYEVYKEALIEVLASSKK